MLAVAAQRAYEQSLLELPMASVERGDGDPPPLGDLLAQARDAEVVAVRRLPAPRH